MFKLGVCRIKSEALTTSTLTRKCEQGLRTFSVLFTSGGKDQRKILVHVRCTAKCKHTLTISRVLLLPPLRTCPHCKKKGSRVI